MKDFSDAVIWIFLTTGLVGVITMAYVAGSYQGKMKERAALTQGIINQTESVYYEGYGDGRKDERLECTNTCTQQ